MTWVILAVWLIAPNADWLADAGHVARVTGSPVFQVMDPLHREWAPRYEVLESDETTDSEAMDR